ncbi:MAG: discoidin domain-containing protein [Elusimicrobia bacterium]|nr:discoidin domain-containing protein [Elusimicrobiota bacterium]
MKVAIAPAAVTNLTSLYNYGDQVTLRWTSPGDNDVTGTLPVGSRFAIQYSTYVVAWATYSVVGATNVYISTSGVNPGQYCYTTITGLMNNSSSYFYIWTQDDTFLWSAVSNACTAYLSLSALSAPALYYPSTATWSNADKCYWSNVTSATSYYLQIDDDVGFGSLNLSYEGVPSSATVSSLSENTTYYWRVKSKDSSGKYSAWSSTRSFDLDVTDAVFSNPQVKLTTGPWVANTSTLYVNVSTPQIQVNVQDANYSGLMAGKTELVTSSGCVGLWHLNGNAVDYSGYGNDGTIDSAQWDSITTWKTTGGSENMLLFNGSNDRIDCGNAVSLRNFINKMSISLWSYQTTAQNANLKIAVSKVNDWEFGDIGATHDWGFYAVNLSGDHWVVGGVSTTRNAWHHMIFTYDGAAGRIYKDGVLALEVARTGNISVTAADHVWIGALSGNTYPFDGYLDEVVLWDRVLSPEEIAVMYNSCAVKYSSSAWTNSAIITSTSTDPMVLTTGSDGTTTLQFSTGTAIPFKHNSSAFGTLSNNRIQFLARDKAGNYAESVSYTINVDTVPPAAITSLTGLLSVTNVNLTWTSPGTDGTIDAISNGQFLIRRATWSVTPESMWGYGYDTKPAVIEQEVIIDTGTTTALPAGSLCRYTSGGLSTATTYYFKVWTKDTAGNWSTLSNGCTFYGGDVTAPAAVTNLTSLYNYGDQVTLRWTSPGDDDITGSLSPGKFAIQYSTYVVAWATYSVVGATNVYISTSGVNPGDYCYTTITGLMTPASSYFRIWTEDDSSLWSAMSNGCTAYMSTSTLSAPTLYYPSTAVWSNVNKCVWSSVTNATSYYLQIDDDINFGSVNFTYEGKSSSASISGLSENTTYYWRVKTKDSSSKYSFWSSTRSFDLDTTDAVFTNPMVTTSSGGWVPNTAYVNVSTPQIQVSVQDTYSGLQIGQTELVTSSGCVGLWHLNSNTLDSSGCGNDGSLVGSPSYATVSSWKKTAATEKILNVVAANTQYVDIPTNASFANLTNKLTVSVWARRTGGAVQQIAVARSTDWRFGDQGDGTWSFYAPSPWGAGAGGWFPSVGVAVPANQWHHMVFTYDGATARVYKDGILGSQKAATGNLLTTNNIDIGGWATSICFTGYLDEVGIWERALSPEEIAVLYNSCAVKYSTNAWTNSAIVVSTTTEPLVLTTGSDGTTTLQFSTGTAIPFIHNSAAFSTLSKNQVQFLTRDAAGNYAESASYTINVDTVAPSAITSLTGLVSGNNINLCWVSPGTDGTIDALSNGQFLIRRATWSVIPSNSKWGFGYETTLPHAITEEVRIDTGTTSSITQLSLCCYTFTNLTGNATYYFRVWTRDQGGNWSDLSNSCTVYMPVLSPPTLYYPSTATWTNANTCDWSDVAGASAYYFEVDDDINFGSPVPGFGDVTPSSAIITSLSENTKYYWHVKTKGSNGAYGDWSSTRSFTLDLTDAVFGNNPRVKVAGMSATASSVENNYGYDFQPNNAIDSDVSTRWSSAYSDPQWIAIDLGQTYNITQVVLKWEAAYGKDYTIQVSANNTDWSTIYTKSGGTGGTENITLSGSGRYIRMYGTVRGTANGYSLWEFETWAENTASTYVNVSTPQVQVSVQDANYSGLRVGQTETIASTGCVLLMHLNGNTTDYSGYGNDCTRKNGVTWSSTPTWKSTGGNEYPLYFDKTDDWVYVDTVTYPTANMSNLNFERTDPFSFSVWLKPDLNNKTLTQIAFCNMTDAALTGYNFQTNYDYVNSIQVTNYISFFLNNTWGTKSIAVSSKVATKLNDGSWHHYVVTYSGSGVASGVKMYEDGLEIGLAAKYDNLGANTIKSADPLSIGGRANGSLLYHEIFSGYIDEFGAWNRVLSPEEIAVMYNSCAVKYSTTAWTNSAIITSTATMSTSGTDGTTALQISTASAVPFKHGTNNMIQFLTRDEAGNYAESVSYTINVDTVPPYTITSLSGLIVATSSGTIKLAWSAPGSDGPTGNLVNGCYYEIRYCTSTANRTWTFMAVVSSPTSTDTIAPESFLTTTFSDLVGENTYYYLIRYHDQAGNWSALSNEATAYSQPLTLSVDITAGDTQSLGRVNIGDSTQTVTAIQIKNDGNVTENFALRCETATAGGSPWYSNETSTTTLDSFLLKALFNSTMPQINYFSLRDIVSDNEYLLPIVDGRYSDDDNGLGVTAGTSKNLWLRLDLPGKTSTIATQTIYLYIQAQSP